MSQQGSEETRTSSSALQKKSNMIVRCHAFVRGRVQGVFYRKYAHKTAEELGLRGWVQNLPDGRVEWVAEGTRENIDSFVKWCHGGSPKARVEGVDVTTVAEGIKYSFERFEIRR
uniref:acylphosphatase n=1 Tax=Trypanosoma congolense (strain IL3000) TaxID=1068625 RepID=G0UJY2_TRYCI|nr:putative acylphosphatase [Trypanosoma congolense IL3000]